MGAFWIDDGASALTQVNRSFALTPPAGWTCLAGNDDGNPMKMGGSNSLLGAAAPGFDEPLEMLRACHGRIEAQCQTLEKLLVHLAQSGCDEQARQAATAVLRYFNTAGRHHHADEEVNLFPALLQSVATPQAAEMQALVAGLLGEHAEMEQAWARLRAPLLRVSEGKGTDLPPADVADFTGRYRRHIATENSMLLPWADRLLSPEQRERLGRAMAERRGVRQ